MVASRIFCSLSLGIRERCGLSMNEACGLGDPGQHCRAGPECDVRIDEEVTFSCL